ncbi:MAG: hypothetical protein VYB35_13015, partial [Verrucomicrobiota bacterium]|nr:hypothetical protein [Verrucomicrobiota bacterium]
MRLDFAAPYIGRSSISFGLPVNILPNGAAIFSAINGVRVSAKNTAEGSTIKKSSIRTSVPEAF